MFEVLAMMTVRSMRGRPLRGSCRLGNSSSTSAISLPRSSHRPRMRERELMSRAILVLHPADRLVVGVFAGRGDPAHDAWTDARWNETKLRPWRRDPADRLARPDGLSRTHLGFETEAQRRRVTGARLDERLV